MQTVLALPAMSVELFVLEFLESIWGEWFSNYVIVFVQLDLCFV